LSKLNDLTEKVFERLTVLKRVSRPEGLKGDGTYWLCECNCIEKNKITVSSSHLVTGHTKSCGCYRVDKSRINTKKYNNYINAYDGIGIGYDLKTNEELFMFDWEDLKLIEKYGWYNDGRYISANDLTGNNAKIRLHRLVMSAFLNIDIKEVGIIDHENRITSDNRKVNLRVVTQQQNAINKSMLSNNTTGFMGIYVKGNGYWSCLGMDGKTIRLGTFKNIEDAIIARLKAEKLYFGEFAPQRHLFEQYGI
jgi:hypothetical protein